MTKVVRFRTGSGTYAVPVEHAREVRSADGVVPLPSPGAGVAGMLRHGDETVPVLDVLGAGGRHVLVVEADGRVFGVVAEEVLGVEAVPRIDPAPSGQDHPLLAGVVHERDELLLVADVDALARTVAR
ncbi:MAG: chemotaxis protein CheW [Actinobacteria bacterium]|nr:chemotaxis protein CheW [Actinomycetota bacterium]